MIYQPQARSLIYAPWRADYVNTLPDAQQIVEKSTDESCVFCHIISHKDNTKNLVVHRGNHSLIMLASQPYINNGIHFLIVPYEHTRELSDLSPETYNEENILTQKLCALFSRTCNEIYINTNQGTSAGASLPTHQHKHVIFNNAPRYYNLIQAIRKTKTTIDLASLFHTIQPQMSTLQNIVIPQQSNNNLYDNECYHCLILKNDALENLIIHSGKYSTVMMSHYPTHLGEIDIVPNDHITSLETMPLETYKEINNLTIAIYPLLLKILKTQDSNIGLISYSINATHKKHIKQKLIPRKNSWITSPITEAHHLNANIKELYNNLLSAWQLILCKNSYVQQASKL